MKNLLKILFIILLFSFISCNTDEESNENSEKNIFEQLSQNKKQKVSPINKNIKFTASAEKVVEVGEMFQLIYFINEEADNFAAPSLDNFDLLSGPSVSTSSSIRIINGKTSRSISNRYIYNLSCQKAGVFTINPAEITISGNTYKSNSIQIKVIGDENNNSEKSSSKENTKKLLSSNKDVFINTSYSKTKVYKGEHIVATTKLYTRKDFQNISEIKFPDYKEFWSEVLQAPRQISFKNEELNGKIYQVAILKQILLYPQKPGKYTISPYEIELQLKKKDGKTRDFFGNIVDHYKLINKRLSTKKQVIVVSPLPQAIPQNFSGITGANIVIENAIDNTNIKTDESAKLQIKVSGNGNLYLLNDLKLQLPEGIEHFKPEVKKNEKYTENGAYVEKLFEYIIVGNEIGTYKIPPFQFIYFDTKEERYKTSYGTELILNVGKGASYIPKKNNKNISEKDIRFIKTNNLSLDKKSDSFAGSLLFYLILATIILVYVILLIIRKKNIEKNKDVVTVKKRNAGKVSQKRLKTALKYMNENKNQEFYKEILTSIWGYLGDKMSISSDLLTNESLKNILKEQKIEESTINKLIDIIQLCGYAQYSPSNDENKPENIYKKTENIINELESVI